MLLRELLEGRIEPKQVKGDPALSPMPFAVVGVIEELLLTH